MDGLPTPVPQGNNPINTPQKFYPTGSGLSGQVNTPVNGAVSGGIGGKELEMVGAGFEEPGLKDVSGQEIELPREVAAAGVSNKPTTVQLPQPVSQMGVKVVGDAVVPATPPVALPLTDDQIALGLKQSVTTSWRWLAEFCVRKLKQLHKKIVKSS